MPEKVGKVVQVIGPVVDIKFDSASLPMWSWTTYGWWYC